MKGPLIDMALVKLACGDGNIDAISELSLDLLSNVNRRRAQIKTGEMQLVSRGHALADSLINNFAYRMIKACCHQALAPPSELVELIQCQLNQDRAPSRSARRYVQRCEAIAFKADHPDAGVNEIARAVGVNPSTVSRWLQAEKI